MSCFKFLHAADIHLDSPLVNLDRYDGAPVDEFRGATRRAFENLVELAIAEAVRFILIAGDLYDGDCRDFNTPRWLRKKMEGLQAAGISVFVIQGNHDAQSRMKKAFRLQLPANVHLFATNQPETQAIEDLQVAIHGQGFATEAVTEDLSARYPPPRSGWLNIGLLHTSCGTYESHENYAPSTEPGLTAKGYDYWALGHIHRRRVLHKNDPWIVYPGNIQGRHINERGAKGCTLVTVEDGQVTSVEHRVVDVLRWVDCTADANGCVNAAQVLAKVEGGIRAALAKAEDRLLAVRVEVTGASEAHRELMLHATHWDTELRERVVDAFGDQVWVEQIEIRTRTALDLEALEERDDALGGLLRQVRSQDSAREALAEIRGDTEHMLSRLPSDPRIGERFIDLDDPSQVALLLEDVKQLLIPRLLEYEDTP